KRVAFLEYAGALVYQSIDAPVDDFLRRNQPLLDTGLGSPFADHLGHFRIGNCPPVLVILVPAGPGLLAIAAHFAQAVLGERLPLTWLFQVPVLLANPPAHIPPRQVTGGERSHRHAEVVQRFVDRFDACPFFDQKLRLTPIRTEHPVAHKAAAVADHHSDLTQSFRKRHTTRDDILAAGFATDDF